jgi:hypothetical protein
VRNVDADADADAGAELGIFISYRRQDSSGWAGRLHDALTARFGAEQVFRDIDNIPLGADFSEVLEDKLRGCDVLLALIGPAWLTATDSKGRRLDDSDDYLRRELEAALARGVLVIPVLLEQVAMPRSADLPESLSSLARREALELSDRHWHADLEKLFDALESLPEHRTGEIAAAQPGTDEPEPVPFVRGRLAIDGTGITDRMRPYVGPGETRYWSRRRIRLWIKRPSGDVVEFFEWSHSKGVASARTDVLALTVASLLGDDVKLDPALPTTETELREQPAIQLAWTEPPGPDGKPCAAVVAKVELETIDYVFGAMGVGNPPLINSVLEECTARPLDAVADLASSTRPHRLEFSFPLPPGWQVSEEALTTTVNIRSQAIDVILLRVFSETETLEEFAPRSWSWLAGLNGYGATILAPGPNLCGSPSVVGRYFLEESAGLHLFTRIGNYNVRGHIGLRGNDAAGWARAWPLDELAAFFSFEPTDHSD